MFSPQGPSLRELAMQALTSVEGGYDLLAPKFDHTPFRTPDGVLDATASALRPLGPFSRGLDVCCGTGAGMRVLRSLCQGRVMGVDFSAGMLARARGAHPDAQWVRADVRALPFAGAFDLAASAGPAQRHTRGRRGGDQHGSAGHLGDQQRRVGPAAASPKIMAHRPRCSSRPRTDRLPPACPAHEVAVSHPADTAAVSLPVLRDLRTVPIPPPA